MNNFYVIPWWLFLSATHYHPRDLLSRIQVTFISENHLIIIQESTPMSSLKTIQLSSPTWLGIQTLLIMDSRFRGNDCRCHPRRYTICHPRKNTHCHPRNILSRIQVPFHLRKPSHYHPRKQYNCHPRKPLQCHPQLDWGSSVFFLFLLF